MNRRRKGVYWGLGLVAAVLTLGVLAACGGDGEEAAPPPPAEETTPAEPAPEPAPAPAPAPAEEPPPASVDTSGAPYQFTLLDGFQFKLNDATTAKLASGEKLKFAYIAYVTPVPFWAPVRDGLEDAAEEFGVDVEFAGPEDSNAQAQVDLIETYLRTGVDGIVAVGFDPATLGPVIQRTMEAGVPVFTSNIDTPDAPRIAFVGQDLVDSGRVAAEQLIQALDSKRPNWRDEPTKIGLFGEDSALEYVKLRLEGAQARLNQESTNVEYVGPFDATFDTAQAFAVAENAFTADPDIAGMIHAGISHVQAGEYLVRNDLVGSVANVGFNFFPGTEEGMRSGAIDASVGQIPYLQGYDPIRYLVDLLTNGTIPACAPVCYVGAEVANQANVNEFDFDRTA